MPFSLESYAPFNLFLLGEPSTCSKSGLKSLIFFILTLPVNEFFHLFTHWHASIYSINDCPAWHPASTMFARLYPQKNNIQTLYLPHMGSINSEWFFAIFANFLQWLLLRFSADFVQLQNRHLDVNFFLQRERDKIVLALFTRYYLFACLSTVNSQQSKTIISDNRKRKGSRYRSSFSNLLSFLSETRKIYRTSFRKKCIAPKTCHSPNIIRENAQSFSSRNLQVTNESAPQLLFCCLNM